MVATKLLAATKLAITLWVTASSGRVDLTLVDRCERGCISIRQVTALPNGWIGRTQSYEDRVWNVDVLDPDAKVIAHELGHVILGLGFHADQDPAELMSPVVGSKCLGSDSVIRFELLYSSPLRKGCVP